MDKPFIDDYGHEAWELRRLPYGGPDCGGAILIGKYSYDLIVKKHGGMYDINHPIPPWKKLEVYQTHEQKGQDTDSV